MMKKYFFIRIVIILGFAQFSYSAGTAKVIKEDISDLIVKGFEVFDVSVGKTSLLFFKND
jgi:hypothetical protein